MRTTFSIPLFAVSLVVLAARSEAQSQPEYRARVLNTASSEFNPNFVYGADTGQAVGYGNTAGGGTQQALLWNNGSLVNLTPNAVIEGRANAVDAGLQVGSLDFRASVWNGTADSRRSIHPGGYNSSFAYGVHGSSVAGLATLDRPHAVGWNLSTGAFYDFGVGEAFGTNGTDYVGDTYYDPQARLWDFDTGVGVDLSPADSLWSSANAISGGAQVGWAAYGGWNPADGTTFAPGQRVGDHATVWSGTAQSAVDLNPSGFQYSYALATNGRDHVGYGSMAGNRQRALLWSGGEAMVLPETFEGGYGFPEDADGFSRATAVTSDGRIYGFARVSYRVQAVVWEPVPEPASILALVVGVGAVFCRRRG